MNKLSGWIKHYQVAAFFIITFAITWPLFALIFFVLPGNDRIAGWQVCNQAKRVSNACGARDRPIDYL